MTIIKWLNQKASNLLISQFLVKLVLSGPTQSGKSSIIDRYTKDQFNDFMLTTIGVEFTVRTIEVSGIQAKVQIVK